MQFMQIIEVAHHTKGGLTIKWGYFKKRLGRGASEIDFGGVIAQYSQDLNSSHRQSRRYRLRRGQWEIVGADDMDGKPEGCVSREARLIGARGGARQGRLGT